MFEPNVPKEIQRRVFELTLALYRVTDFFPQGEVLRKHLRDKANEVFGGISEYGFSRDFSREAGSIIAKTQAMKGYLALARSARFVKSINITVLEREYDFLADFFGQKFYEEKVEKTEAEQPRPVEKTEDFKPRKEEPAAKKLSTWKDFASQDNSGSGFTSISSLISDRQQKILEHIRQNDKAKISDFAQYFSGISTKTIQRDLQEMVTKNLLKKEGEKRWTVYSLNGHS